jgi:hypothetical protein
MQIGFVDITEVNRKGPPGWYIISWFTSSPIVHAFVVFDDMVYQTSEIFFEKIPLSWRLMGTPCHIFTVVNPVEKEAKEYAETMIGKLYDYLGIAYMGLMTFTEKIINWIAYPVRLFLSKANKKPMEMFRVAWLGNSYQIDQAYFCTEATFHILTVAKVPMPNWWEGYNVTPDQFYNYCKSHPELFHYEGKITQ